MAYTPLIEVCVEGIDGLLAAQEAGADRVELCASLVEGGITPSIGTVREALRRTRIPFHVIVRPRGGDFLYSDAEFASMVGDVETLRDMGVAGVVVGCLSPDGTVDAARMQALVSAAGQINVTCHRAFDMTRDPFEALEALIACGVGRVLTSGQRDTATEGADLLAELVRRARDRIVILGCGGLDPQNIASICDRTGLREMHFASLADMPSGMSYRNPHVGMGGTDLDREYRNTITDGAMVARTIAAARTAHALLHPIMPADEAAILDLNNAHTAELSPINAPKLTKLVGEAFYARRIGALDAFAIVFDQDADYDSPNFLWFRERHPRFVYVDRICVAPGARGMGHARRIYEDLFRMAGAAGHTLITCEVYSEPPNPVSDAFHAALGFREVGTAPVEGGTKAVRYFEKRLTTG